MYDKKIELGEHFSFGLADSVDELAAAIIAE